MKAFNHKKLPFRILLTTISLSLITLLHPLTAYAYDTDKIVASIVNSISTNGGGGGTSGYSNGVSYTKTGYLVYMVNKQSGAKTSSEIKYLCSNPYAGTVDITEGRRGGSGLLAGTPPWNLTPWNYVGGNTVSNEPEIKQWFIENGHNFVQQYFPANLSKFETDEEVIVVETLMNFQFQDCLGKSTISDAQARLLAQARMAERGINDNYIMVTYMLPPRDSSTQYLYDRIYTGVIEELAKQIMAEGTVGTNTHYESPYLGTVANLIDKRVSLPESASFADSYLKAIAPRSEYIKKSEAGFTNWTGGFPMSLSDVKNYGVAMMIIHCMDSSQTTCDEPQIPNPHNPPDESDGTKKIIKNYRTRNLTTNTLTEDGNTFTIEQVSSDILIEDEDKYVVVAWATSSGASFIPSPTWEGSI